MPSMDSFSHDSQRDVHDPFRLTHRAQNNQHRHWHYTDAPLSPEAVDIADPALHLVQSYGDLLTPDGQVIISHDGSGHISVMRYGYIPQHIFLPDVSSIIDLVAASDNGRTFIGNCLDKSGNKRAFFTEMKPEMSPTTTFLPNTDTVVVKSLSGDGNWVVGTASPESGENYAFLWSIQTGKHDLGTLGGASSAAHAISSDGNVIIGESRTPSGRTHGFRIVERGPMEDLGALGGGFSVATALTPTGDVIVGYSTVESGQRRTFRWTEQGGIEDLGTVGDPDFPGNHSSPCGVSDDGETVGGVFQTSTWQNHTFRWTRQDGMVDIAPSAGQVQGTLLSADGSTLAGKISKIRGFVWNKTQGHIEDIGTLGGQYTFPSALSADGSVIIGTSELSNGGKYIFRWTRATGLENMGRVIADRYRIYHVKGGNKRNNAKDTLLVGVNYADKTLFTHKHDEGTKVVVQFLQTNYEPISFSEDGGFIAGTGVGVDEGLNHDMAFRFTIGGEKIYLGSLDPIYSKKSYAFAVSNDGTVVGAAFDGFKQQRAFRWTERNGMVDLGTLGGTQATANAISANGVWITGISQNEAGDNHAFRWSQRDGMRDLGTLADFSMSSGLAVSSEGVVYGDVTSNNYGSRVFRWTEQYGMEDLGTLGGPETSLLNMSADGSTVIGLSSTSEDYYAHRIFRWTEAGGIVDVGIPTRPDIHTRSYHPGISSDGKVIVATHWDNTSGFTSAVRWSLSQGVQRLGPIGRNSIATSVSDDGLVVGGARSLDPRNLCEIACYWKITQISTNTDYIVLPQHHPITEDAFLKKLGATTDDGSRISTTLDPSMFWHLGKRPVVLLANGTKKIIVLEIVPYYPPLDRGAGSC